MQCEHTWADYLSARNISQTFAAKRPWLNGMAASFVRQHRVVLTADDAAAVGAQTFRLLWDAMQVQPVPTCGLALWLTLAACWCIAVKTIMDVDHPTWYCVHLAAQQLALEPDCANTDIPQLKSQLHTRELQLLAQLQWRVSPTRRHVVHPARPCVPAWVDVGIHNETS